MLPIKETIRKIFQKNKKAPSPALLADAFELIRTLPREEEAQLNAEVRILAAAGVRKSSAQEAEQYYSLLKRALLLDAPCDFDAYLQYVEWPREPEKKFYPPRRRVLLPLVRDLQDLADGKLDFLGISLPPRVGKSTLCIFFMTWMMGRNPDVANVMSGHSDKLTDGFYRELLSILTDGESYLWSDVFPAASMVDNSAKNETIDLNRKKRFPTITCRSVGGTLTGAVEIGRGGILYVDDIIEDLEEALNPDRLQAKYDAYLNQLKDRKKDGAVELMVGTRWNVLDPLGRIEDQYQDNPRYRFRIIPAIDENGESNFDYDYGVGFSTAYYRDMKSSIDDATWCAKYLGRPYVREGLLFPIDEVRTYNGTLPSGEPDRILAAIDIAWGGGDSLSAPIGYCYGDSCYIADVAFSRGDKTVTLPLLAGKFAHHLPHIVQAEANNGGAEYAEQLEGLLRERGVRLCVTAQRSPTTTSKLSRIIQMSPEIKRFYFLDEAHQDSAYKLFMRELTTFSISGKNPHDDAPDSLAQLAALIYGGIGRVVVFQRPF